MDPLISPQQVSPELGENFRASLGTLSSHIHPPAVNSALPAEEEVVSMETQLSTPLDSSSPFSTTVSSLETNSEGGLDVSSPSIEDDCRPDIDTRAQLVQRAQVAASDPFSPLENGEIVGFGELPHSLAPSEVQSSLVGDFQTSQKPFQNLQQSQPFNTSCEIENSSQTSMQHNISEPARIFEIPNPPLLGPKAKGFQMNHLPFSPSIIPNKSFISTGTDNIRFSVGKHAETVPNDKSNTSGFPGSSSFTSDKNQENNTITRSYAQVLTPGQFNSFVPSKGDSPECGIVLERLKFTVFDDYVMAIEKITGRNSVVFIGHSPENNDQLLVFLEKPFMATKLVAIGITVNRRWICISHFQEPATRVVISDVLPFIQDEAIINACRPFGRPVYSSLRRIPAAIRDSRYRHVLSFRRELFIILNSPSSLPESISIFSNKKVYKLPLSTSSLFCSNCKKPGHHYSSCQLSSASKEDGSGFQVPMAASIPISPSFKPASNILVQDQLHSLPQRVIPSKTVIESPQLMNGILPKTKQAEMTETRTLLVSHRDHKANPKQKQQTELRQNQKNQSVSQRSQKSHGPACTSIKEKPPSNRNHSPPEIVQKRPKLFEVGGKDSSSPDGTDVMTLGLDRADSRENMEQGYYGLNGDTYFVERNTKDLQLKESLQSDNQFKSVKKTKKRASGGDTLIPSVSISSASTCSLDTAESRTNSFCVTTCKSLLAEVKKLKSSKRMAVISSYSSKFPDLKEILEVAQESPSFKTSSGQTFKSVLNIQDDLCSLEKSQTSRPLRQSQTL